MPIHRCYHPYLVPVLNLCSVRTPLSVLTSLAHANPLAFQPLVPLVFASLQPLATGVLTKGLFPSVVASVVSSALIGTPLFQQSDSIADTITLTLTQPVAAITLTPELLDEVKVCVCVPPG